MSLESKFCNSPWLHMRITANGVYNWCRWKNTKEENPDHNIYVMSPKDYFLNHMEDKRKLMIDGEGHSECAWCYDMEKHGKISGRQKQLIKNGIDLENLETTMLSSPYYDEFKKTAEGQKVSVLPKDWQIDLGNQCNGACVYCTPRYSSKLVSEYIKLGFLDKAPPKPWVDNPENVQRFIDTLKETNEIHYLHFIGGETIVMPPFKEILRQLVENGLTSATIGFTTNLTVWDEEVNDLLSKFKQVCVGMSIDAIHEVNDYARYPAKIDKVKEILYKWVDLGRKHDWLLQLRPTPTWITIEYLDTVFEYGYENDILVESCNFLTDPKFMRMNLLPKNLRQIAIDKIRNWIESKETFGDFNPINNRNPHVAKQAIIEDAKSYLSYLETSPYEDAANDELIDFLHKVEANRNNKVTDYIPHYEEFLRTIGY